MRILIADDHELFRDGLRMVLSDLSTDLDITEAATYDDALGLVGQVDDGETVPFDLILVDLVMPGLPWTEGLAALRATAPRTPVVVLSANEDRRLVLEAVRLGAAGFIPKTSSSKVMIRALDLVLSGGVYLPTTLLEDAPTPAAAAMALALAEPSPTASFSSAADGEAAAVSPLTPRQREVLALLGLGKSNKEIARHLVLSEGTVKLHVTAILKALNVSNRTGAVVAAQRLGLTK
ncbi:MAG: response regulator transcription factor [Rhodospirillum sp.]|nr:response regulator transcription factor [Rhodospirillum sp.]MCF8491724.1 response regulator transcription factor [Rhodospirillum sp.]MCF8499455.1 response regulator transcription factor [Rhodospirillum sp.]